MPLAVLAVASRASCTVFEGFLDPGLRRDDDFQSDAPNGVFSTEARIQHDFQSGAPTGVFSTEARIQYDFQSDAPNYVLLAEAGIQRESSILRARFSVQRSRSGHPGAGRDPVQIKYSADSISGTYI